MIKTYSNCRLAMQAAISILKEACDGDSTPSERYHIINVDIKDIKLLSFKQCTSQEYPIKCISDIIDHNSTMRVAIFGPPDVGKTSLWREIVSYNPQINKSPDFIDEDDGMFQRFFTTVDMLAAKKADIIFFIDIDVNTLAEHIKKTDRELSVDKIYKIETDPLKAAHNRLKQFKDKINKLKEIKSYIAFKTVDGE